MPPGLFNKALRAEKKPLRFKNHEKIMKEIIKKIIRKSSKIIKKRHPELIGKSWENHPDENPEKIFFGDPTYRVKLKTIFLKWSKKI